MGETMFHRLWQRLFGSPDRKLEENLMRLRTIQALQRAGTPHGDALANELMKVSLREIGIPSAENQASPTTDKKEKIDNNR